MKYLATVLLLLACFTGVKAQECYVDEEPILQVVCFDNNLKAPLDSLGVPWAFPKDQQEYAAITLTRMQEDSTVIAVTVFREVVLIEYIPHEVSHVAEYMGLDDEARADFIGIQSTKIINLTLYRGIPLYTIIDGEKIYFN